MPQKTSKNDLMVFVVNHRLSCHIEKLRAAAKLTQQMYGISNKPAFLETLEKPMMVKTFAIQSPTISIKASNRSCSPKNRN